MTSFLPLISRLRRRLARPLGIEDIAVEIDELAPPFVREVMPAISLPDEIDRVERFEPTNSPKIHYDRLYAREQRHGPTMAYCFDNAILHHGTLYFAKQYRTFTKTPDKVLITGRPNFLNEAQFAASPLEHIYFGHWLHDTLPLEILASDRGLIPLRPSDPPWMHTSGYRALLGSSPQSEEHAHIAKLWIIDDRGLNKNWSDRFCRVRKSLQASRLKSGNERVFISRGRSGARREISNLDEVQAALSDAGFVTLHPERETPQTIIQALSNARIVVGMEGSALAHAILALPKGASLVTIQPATFFNTIFKLFADMADIRYAFVVADRANQDSSVNVGRLLRTIEIAETQVD